MPTKTGKKVAPQKPLVFFYIAEDLRQEVNGKVSAMGLYPDNVILLPLPDDAQEPTESKPLFIKSLGFLFCVTNFSQRSTISIDIEVNGKRKPFMQPGEYPSPGPGRSINVFGVMQPCAVAYFGKRKLIVRVGESEYTFDYEIRRAPLSHIGEVPEKIIKTPKIRKDALSARKKTSRAA